MDVKADLEKHDLHDVQIHNSTVDAVYGIGIIGAWIYLVGRETTWKGRAVAVLKGFVWPAVLVYQAFQFMNKE